MLDACNLEFVYEVQYLQRKFGSISSNNHWGEHMVRGGAMLKAWFRFTACLFGLALPLMAQAVEVDLDEPVKVAPGKGIAVFSITYKCHSPDEDDWKYVKWRAADGGKIHAGDGRSGEIRTKGGSFFRTEEFYKTRHVWGRLAALSLEPGNYEFYGYHSARNNGNGWSYFSEWHEFSMPFTVAADKVQYVGDLDICMGSAFMGGGGKLAGFLVGAWTGTVEVFPSLLDASDVDLPLLFTKKNGLTKADVQINVIPNDNGRHTQDMFNTMKQKAEQGDASAQRCLLLGLMRGKARTESGEQFKVEPDKDLEHHLAQQLATQGISGGAYSLSVLEMPEIEEFPSVSLPSDGDGAKLLAEVVGDAERYFQPAMSAASLLYNSDVHGIDTNTSQTRLWSAREQSMYTIDLASVPYLDKAGKAEFEKFRHAPVPRYFALSVSGAYGMSSGDDASAQAAIAACEARNTGAVEHCRLYAEHEQAVWDACPASYAGSKESVFPPETGLGKVSDTSHLPASMSKDGKTAYLDFLKLRMPRAFAVADTGEFSVASGDCHAAYKALQKCHELSGHACKLYALDDQIVLGATDSRLLDEEKRLATLLELTAQDTAKLTSEMASMHSVPIGNKN